MSKKELAIQMTMLPAKKTDLFYVTETALVFREKIPSQRTIEGTYKVAKVAKKSSPWWIGDCIVAGEDYHGEQSSQMFDPDELAHETESNYANVCRAFSAPRRRGKPLSFSHHAVVYKLEDGIREQFLDDAIKNGWSEKELRAEVQKWRSSKTVPVTAHQRNIPGTDTKEAIRMEFDHANRKEVENFANDLKARGVIDGWDSCE